LGAILQAQRVQVGTVWIPTGFFVAIAVLVPLSRAAAWWLRSRLGAVYLGIGWLIGTLAMGTSSPWGDLILDSGTRQLAYLVIGAVLLAAAATLPLLDDDPAAADPLVTAADQAWTSDGDQGHDRRTGRADG
jgi:hypothetical protein